MYLLHFCIHKHTKLVFYIILLSLLVNQLLYFVTKLTTFVWPPLNFTKRPSTGSGGLLSRSQPSLWNETSTPFTAPRGWKLYRAAADHAQELETCEMELQNSAGWDAVRPNVLNVVGCNELPWRVDTGPWVTDAKVRFSWKFWQNSYITIIIMV